MFHYLEKRKSFIQEVTDKIIKIIEEANAFNSIIR